MKPNPNTSSKPPSPDADLQIIEEALKRNRNLKMWVGLLLLLLGVFVIFPYLIPHTALLAIAGTLIVSFTGIYFLLHGLLRYDVQKNHLLRIIAHQPENVVWVFNYKIERLPFGIKLMEVNTLYIYLLNREQISIPIQKSQIQELLLLLKKRLPDTTFGYSPQHAQLYNISPDLLKQEK